MTRRSAVAMVAAMLLIFALVPIAPAASPLADGRDARQRIGHRPAQRSPALDLREDAAGQGEEDQLQECQP